MFQGPDLQRTTPYRSSVVVPTKGILIYGRTFFNTGVTAQRLTSITSQWINGPGLVDTQLDTSQCILQVIVAVKCNMWNKKKFWKIENKIEIKPLKDVFLQPHEHPKQHLAKTLSTMNSFFVNINTFVYFRFMMTWRSFSEARKYPGQFWLTTGRLRLTHSRHNSLQKRVRTALVHCIKVKVLFLAITFSFFWS